MWLTPQGSRDESLITTTRRARNRSGAEGTRIPRLLWPPSHHLLSSRLSSLSSLVSLISVPACRVYLNISQEGKDDIDDLRELGLVNGLKLSSGGFQVRP